jgi:hypothetical protein
MWPTISNIDGGVANTINSYAYDTLAASKLNAWIRVFSGALTSKGNGLILESNTDFKIFSAAGEADSIYGNSDRSGAVGRDWNGNVVVTDTGRVLRPSPIITSFSSKEGQDQISRTCEFTITCFSLQQLELVQDYFMEPGYSVGVEWGHNTGNSAKGLINTGGKQAGILKSIADVTLNNGELSKVRSLTSGQYDIFLGFIVGSSVSNEGENFKVDVKLRGAPSLPTYLQSQNRITVKSAGVEPDPDKSTILYSEAELVSDGDSEEEAKKRRFKYMFNELPAFRQTESVKKLIDKTKANDYINFDKLISLKIDEVLETLAVDADVESDVTETGDSKVIKITSDGVEASIPKEKLFSKNRYIRFGLAIDILNEMGKVDKYEIGGKSISFKINIDTAVAGAFPYMFSTKASKLLILHSVPNFKNSYFLSSDEIVQQRNGLINKLGPVALPKFLDYEFSQRIDLNNFGLKEKKLYWGYIKNLYVNFDMFKSKIEQKNKNIREILQDILNEMSSAVNSFWNFQIVESEYKKTPEQVGEELRQNAPYVAARTTTFNPNLSGYTPGAGFTNSAGTSVGGGFGVSGTTTTTPIGGAGGFNPVGGGFTVGTGINPTTFGKFAWKPTQTATGTTTVAAGGANNTSSTGTFNAVSKENDIVISIIDENWIGQNPDPGGIQTFLHSGIGSPFLNSSLDISIPAEMANKIINDRLGNNSQTDMATIKTGKIFNSNTDLFLSRTGNSAETGTSGTSGTAETELTNEDEVKAANAKKITDVIAKIDPSKTESFLKPGQSRTQITNFKDKDGNIIKTLEGMSRTYPPTAIDDSGATSVSYPTLNLTAEEISEAATAEAAAKSERITTNLEKIDVVPKPNRYKLGASLATSLPDAVQIDFFVFCLDDTDFFESIKNYYLDQSSTSLSQPLPIKYSFTTFGNSGIRRGDTFKIFGIPRKYADNGIFQVTGIEHSISGMRWETTVEALYRQTQ